VTISGPAVPVDVSDGRRRHDLRPLSGGRGIHDHDREAVERFPVVAPGVDAAIETVATISRPGFPSRSARTGVERNPGWILCAGDAVRRASAMAVTGKPARRSPAA